MKWKKQGLIYCTQGDHAWMQSHAQDPVADPAGPDRLRVYFATRDKTNRTVTTYVELDAENLQHVLYVHDRPILPLGELGAFDDCGVMSSAIVEHEGTKYFYYTGWNTSTSVPYRLSIGLALSEDGGETFRRPYLGPVLERTYREPHFCCAPYVMIDEGTWKMWYTSCTGWEVVQGKPEPRYHIKYAESEDGIRWRQTGVVCIDYDPSREAITRPSVLKTGGQYHMWYCHRALGGYRTERAASYRISYARSADGLDWELHDDFGGLDVSESGWDADMTAYPWVFPHRGKTVMLYNGNGFGRSGFGYAILQEEAE